MRTLDRYIGISVAKGYFLIMLILLSVFSFLEFVEQLDEVGKGDYRLADALIFITLTLPRRMLDLVPVTALLGGCIALGNLANGSELIAMRAAGVSVSRIAWSVMKAGIILMLAVAVVEELVAPPLQQFAQRRQSLALNGADRSDMERGFWSREGLRFINASQFLNGRIPARIDMTEQGFWSRDGRRFVNVRTILQGDTPADIDIYIFDAQGRLQQLIHADSADIGDGTNWVLLDVTRKVLLGTELIIDAFPSLPWRSFLAAEQIRTEERIRELALPTQNLSPSDLYRYIGYLQDGGQPTERYELAFWHKLSLPLTTGAMVLLSIPFVFGSLRTVTMGQRIILGSMVGIAFYLTNRIIANVGLLLKLNAFLTAMLPVLVILVLAALLLRRV